MSRDSRVSSEVAELCKFRHIPRKTRSQSCLLDSNSKKVHRTFLKKNFLYGKVQMRFISYAMYMPVKNMYLMAQVSMNFVI